MTDGFMKCDKCGIFFDGSVPYIEVTQWTPPIEVSPYHPVIMPHIEYWVRKHYCSACAPKVYKPE